MPFRVIGFELRCSLYEQLTSLEILRFSTAKDLQLQLS